MKRMKMALVAAMAAVPVAGNSALASGPGGDLLSAAAQTGKLNAFLEAVDAAGLADKFKGPGPFTLIFPSDEALARLDPGAMGQVMAAKTTEDLARMLKSHVVSGRVTAADLSTAAKPLVTIADTGLTVENRDGLRVGNASVVQSDVTAGNSVIHIVDDLIEPAL